MQRELRKSLDKTSIFPDIRSNCQPVGDVYVYVTATYPTTYNNCNNKLGLLAFLKKIPGLKVTPISTHPKVSNRSKRRLIHSPIK
jgi:hypothetical protein